MDVDGRMLQICLQIQGYTFAWRGYLVAQYTEIESMILI